MGSTNDASQGPLHGLRVLDFGRYIAAPFCAAMLAELGAEVIRVESIGGNDDRSVMPVTEDTGALYLQTNHNKLSLPLDLSHETAPGIIRKLVENSDVVVANMPPTALGRMGLDYASLKAIKPDIILTHVSAFADRGPERDSIGFDGTGQAMSGALHLSGNPGEPFRAAVSYVDYATALASAFGTLAAILARFRTGQGKEVRTSLLGTALAMMNPILIEESLGTRTRVATGNRSPIAGPSDVFRTMDGRIMVQVIGQEMFERWARLVGATDLIADPRFRSDIGRGENGEVLSERMSLWCRDKTNAETVERLRAARIPGCPVLSPAEVLRQPEHLDGGYFDWLPLEALKRDIPLVRLVHFSDDNRRSRRTAPALGEGSEAILRAIGYDDDAIAELRRQGVIHFGPESKRSRTQPTNV